MMRHGLISSVTVTVIPNVFILAHRYSFEDGMTDSIGGADGTLYGEEQYGTKVADGILHLTGQGDKTPETKAEMTKKENRALAQFSL